MRVQLVLLLGAILAMGTVHARAALTPAPIVGTWSADRDCAGAGFAYVMNGGGILHEVRDGSKVYRTPVRVKVLDGMVEVRADEKVYTFRLPTPDTLQPVRYTDTRTRLSVRLSPQTWHRCS